MMTTVDVALDYLRRGWSIIPMRPAMKKPTLQTWSSFQKATPTEKMVRQWFGGHPDRGIAVILGDASQGLICRDFDHMEAFNGWASQNPQLAATLPIVETSRGRHVYCMGDVRQVQEASKNATTIIEFSDGELRGGGYCVLPFSKHPSGTTYTWLRAPDCVIPKLDLVAAGFTRPWTDEGCVTERTERTENTETTENTENTEAIGASQRGLEVSNDSDSSQSIGSLILAAEDSIEHAIVSTLPSSPGQRNKLVFKFARALKAISGISDAPVKELKPYVRRWHELAKPFIATKAFEETWIDFIRAFPKVKLPLGEGDPMVDVLQRATCKPLPPVAEQYEERRIGLLIAICRELQHSVANEPFFLSCRKAGQLLGVDHQTAWRWFNLLEFDEVLIAVQRGGRETNKATRWRYNGG